MKGIRIVLCFFILMLYDNLAAQTVIAMRKANLYPVSSGLVLSSDGAQPNSRLLITVSEEPKTVNKKTEFEVNAFANISKDFHYQGYIVTYKDQKYYLPSDQVVDNALLITQNDDLDKQYSVRLEQLESAQNTFMEQMMQYESSLDSIKQVAHDSLEYYKVLRWPIVSKKYNELRESDQFYDRQIENADKFLLDSLTAVYETWIKSLPSTSQKAIRSIRLLKHLLDSPNSVGGHDVIITYINLSDKTIKYFDWEGKAKNAVNDYVKCTVRDRLLMSGRDTGPVYSGKEGGGTWDNMIYNWSAEELVLTSIKVTYMDGTSLLINGTAIKHLIEDHSHRPPTRMHDDVRYHVTKEERMVMRKVNSLKKEKERATMAIENKYAEQLKPTQASLDYWFAINEAIIAESFDRYPAFFGGLSKPSDSLYKTSLESLQHFKVENFIE